MARGWTSRHWAAGRLGGLDAGGWFTESVQFARDVARTRSENWTGGAACSGKTTRSMSARMDDWLAAGG